ncbi:hypothetical protein [Nitrosomonas sp. HPC101]|uniref:hypothetical protein n=1 Tax=Nitrosomonas sp. HPC101 TaxID=1658667 RepID=UPI001371B78A|nr:hypothetical protein [Nitrosomonas sp. HPC101]
MTRGELWTAGRLLGLAEENDSYGLTTNPTLYGENLKFISGLYAERKRTPTADAVVHVITRNDTVYFPGSYARNYSFDGGTGESLNSTTRENTPAIPFYDGMTLAHVMMDAGGGIWGTSILSPGDGLWSPMDPDTLDLDRRLSVSIEASTYGKAILDVFMTDRTNDLLVAATSGSSASIDIFNFTTGALLDTLNVSGIPQQIIPEDNGRLFVYCKNGMFNLVDYINRRIFSTFKAPLMASPGQIQSIAYTYDRFHRRLLAFQILPDDPINGSCTSRVKGWYPVPLPVRLTKPIPLLLPRSGRNVPCLVRLIGDAGEPVGGVHVQGVMSGVAAAVSPGVSDNNGYAVLHTKATASGVATLTTTAEVATA